MAEDKKVFFTLWLPLNENDFFHSTNKDNNPLDEGAINKAIEYFIANDKFTIKDTSKLYLRENHQFFSNYDNEKYFIDIRQIRDDFEKLKGIDDKKLNDSKRYIKTIGNYLAEEVLENCNLSADKEYIKNSDRKLVEIDNNKISYISLDLTYNKSIKFTLTFDSFGFYFFDFSSNNREEYKEEYALDSITELFGGEYICHSINREHIYKNHNICKHIIKEKNFKKGYYGILTHNQLLYLQEGIMNFNLNHKIFFEIIQKEENLEDKEHNFFRNLLKEYSISKFINKIIVSYSDEYKLKYSKPNLEKGTKVDFDNIKNRKYNFNFLNEQKIKDLNIDLKELNINSENDEILKHILVQDAIEEESMRQFLSIVLTAPYLEDIEDSVYVVRKRLTSRMMELSPESEIDQLSFDSDVIKYLYTEEKLSNYIKLVVSKIPLLFSIDNILRNAYYVKIGNLTDMDFTTDSEQIDSLSLYRTWKGVLNTVQNNQRTLVDNLDSYNQMKIIKIEDESRRLLINSNDREDIKYAWEDKDNNSNIMSLFIIISAVYYIGHTVEKGNWSISTLLYYTLGILSGYILIDKIKKPLSKWYQKVFHGVYDNKQNIEYRKRYAPLDSLSITKVNDEDSTNQVLRELTKIKESYIEKLNTINSEYFFIEKSNEVNIVNSSYSLISEDTYRLNLQLQIPEIRINYKAYDELQIFYVLTLDFRTTKYNRIDYFLDSAKIYYRLKKDAWMYKCFGKCLGKCFQKKDESSQDSTEIKKIENLILLEREIYTKFIDDLFEKKID